MASGCYAHYMMKQKKGHHSHMVEMYKGNINYFGFMYMMSEIGKLVLHSQNMKENTLIPLTKVDR